ncbi:F46H5.3 [Cordylochernes scorpioides]|uniref:arginine kinase n=1 Tax=Cordylochernes scorpioides TaxID=51811 RepID=A0ABY6L3D4_9ARAC|nr:F46H5.3 [Cordylochernes scorpioides]
MLMLWYMFQILNKPRVHESEADINWITCCLKKLEKNNFNSLLTKSLSTRIFDQIKLRKTIWGSTLKDVINTGVVNGSCGIGIYAPDADAYLVFHELFDKIIAEYHSFPETQCHPSQDYGNLSHLIDLDPTGNFVLSTRIRCCRNIEGFPFISKMSLVQFYQVEDTFIRCLKYFPHNLAGIYYPFLNLKEAIIDFLHSSKFLFSNDIKILQDAGVYHYWPAGRGVFHNFDRTLLIWVNSEDHLRFLSMQKGGNLKAVYARIVQATSILDSRIPCYRDERLGYLTFSPIVLGTTFRVTFELKLAHYASCKERIEELQKFCSNDSSIFDLSNRFTLGKNEFDTIIWMQDVIKEIIDIEYKASAVIICNDDRRIVLCEKRPAKPYLGGVETPTIFCRRDDNLMSSAARDSLEEKLYGIAEKHPSRHNSAVCLDEDSITTIDP